MLAQFPGLAQPTLLRVLVYAVKDDLLHECWVLDADQERVDRFLRERSEKHAQCLS